MTTERTILADAQLDWSIHANPIWPLSTTDVFLAEAVVQTGRALCQFWDDALPSWMAHPEPPEMVPAKEAFIDDAPIAEVHAKYGPHVRELMPVAEYRVLFEYGDHPPPTIPGSDEDESEPISRKHWEEAFLRGCQHAHELDPARRAIIPIADFIAKHAVAGRLKIYIRPVAGGEMTEAPSSLWNVGDPRMRISSCAINLEHPFDMEAAPTHHLFVDREDLERELAAITPDQQICLIPGLAGSTADDDIYKASVDEVTELLRALMRDEAHRDWRRLKFQAEAEDKFGPRAGGTVFRRAWTKATEEFSQFSQPGRPRGSR